MPGPGGNGSYGVSADEGSSVYATFSEGGAAIAGIPGRTFVNGFVDGTLNGNDPAVRNLIRPQLEVVADGRGEPQARTEYRIVPANWSLDADGNVASVELDLDRAFQEVGIEGGEIGFAVLADVESTDSEGLQQAKFDIVSDSDSVALAIALVVLPSDAFPAREVVLGQHLIIGGCLWGVIVGFHTFSALCVSSFGR